MLVELKSSGALWEAAKIALIVNRCPRLISQFRDFYLNEELMTVLAAFSIT
jgi:hypothetical protein